MAILSEIVVKMSACIENGRPTKAKGTSTMEDQVWNNRSSAASKLSIP